MTTIASSHGPTEVINARRTESLDAPAILDLVSNHTVEQFGHVNVVHLIEKANLAVTLINEENEVLGFAGFLDYPPLPQDVCDSAKWEEWMKDAKYPVIEKCTALNSLFLHYFVAKSDYTIGCATEIVRTVFNAVPDLHFLFLVLRNNVKPEQALGQIFHQIEGKDGERFNLYGCYRHSHVPVLHIRRAVVEDNDDLLPIFLRLNDNLTQTYGDHFLAELIEAQDEDNHALVAEVGGKAIGFISMCSHVNIDLLQKEYELASFHGLRKPHPDDKLKDDSPPTPPPEDPTVTEAAKPEEQPAEEESRAVLEKSSSQETDDAEDGEDPTEEAPSPSSGIENVERQQTPFEDVPTPVQKPPFEPQYFGESNCFSLQLFCIDELYEMRSADFLPQVFKLFPGKEFAVITVPHFVQEFPLLQHFVRVTPKNSMLVSQELYIFHRGGLLHDFVVRPVVTKDTKQITDLVTALSATQDILNDVEIFNSSRRDDDGTEVQAFVAECLGQIVGVAIVRREENIEYIRSHYNIEDFIYFNHHRRDEHGHLHHFSLNPVFQHYTKQFFKEILRQGHKSCLFYPVEKDCEDNSKKHSLITGINYLVPVRARRQIVYPLDELNENAPSERIVDNMPPYALYHINRKLTLEPKVTINARIIVVGASSVGISFLETLSFCPHLRFNNLTLIAKDGLPDKIHSADYSYTTEQLACMSLATWVNVVQGNMVAIDRSHKYVILEGGEKVSYDYLMLCTGQQYQVPKPTKVDIEEGATNHIISPRAIESPYPYEPPVNVMTINKSMDEKQMMKWITGVKEFQGKVVIYGNSLDAYFTLQSLLSCGVPGQNLALIQPPSSHKFSEPDTFQEHGLVKAVMKAIEDAGVEYHIDCVFADWQMSDVAPNKISEVSFTTPTKPVIIECHAFLSFYPKCIDAWTFKSVNDACLVFDGRLVIDTNFCTNDPVIRAAGPLTKYARRYHAEDWSNHDGYNSCEIGFRLAMSVLPLFDPTLESMIEENDPNDPYSKLTPIFSDCKVFHGYLPGNFEYLHVRKPGATQAYESQLANPNHGHEIETGSVKNGNYFRLHINQMNCVETITCVVKAGEGLPIPVWNITQLYNIHERYLNNLLARVEEGLIADLFEFFREPWCMAIFHDRFRDLRQEVRELLSMPPSGGGSLSSLEAEVQQLVKEDLNISSEQKANLREFYQSIGLKKAVENRLLSFLSYNYYHLPMYAKPGMV
ncbi:cilia- and flagella-associated protein 61-like [Styela clava]